MPLLRSDEEMIIRQVALNIQRVRNQRRDAAEAAQRNQVQRQQEEAAPARRRTHSYWCSPWTNHENRLHFGDWNNLLRDLRVDDTEAYFNYLRMPPRVFDEILRRIEHRIRKTDTRMRKALTPGLKLAATLRHLASGDKYTTIGYQFRVSKKTVSKFVPEVCQAIHDEFVNEVLVLPNTPADWKQIATEFERRWQVPHALGALDGKHIRIRKPPKSGTLYHNYKGYFSVVLLALCDADYKFIWTDIGGIGHQSDCQLYNHSELKAAIDQNILNLPPADPLPHDEEDFPYFFLGDDAFPLRQHMMKPFPLRDLPREQRIYNYRISRGRRVIENTFGIMAQKWQIFLSCMAQCPENIAKIVHSVVCLHNLLRLRMPNAHRANVDREDEDHQIIPGEWRREANMEPIDRRNLGGRDLESAKVQRQTLVAYFNSAAGKVQWQDRMFPLPQQPDPAQ